MIARVVAWCTQRYRLVLVVALLAAVGGEWSRRSLSRDAVPDLSDPQIGVVVDWMGHPASEVADRVTRVLTDGLKSVPGVTTVRGASMSGTAYVDVVFASARSLDPGREEIRKRVANLRGQLPQNMRLQIGPEATSTGWVYQYALYNHSSLAGVPIGRTVQEELLRPALTAVPGVAEVASVGETKQELVVEAEPDRLRARGVAFSDVVAAVRSEAHGDPDLQHIELLPLPGTKAKPLPADAKIVKLPEYVDDGQPMQRMPSMRHPMPVDSSPLFDADKVVPNAHPESNGLRIGDVAHATIASDMPVGIADYNGNSSTVGGIVVAKRDADPKAVIEGVRRTIERLRPRLPPHVELRTVYDRLDLADRVDHTLLRALAEEVGVVVLVILLFLLHGRSALVPLATLPLVLFLTFAGMHLFGVSATIMSLGGIAIALGMAVDADVVALEACHRRIEGQGLGGEAGTRRASILAAAGTVTPAILISLLITALSFLPVFAFSGETGRLLRPLAFTKTLVIVAAALVAVTVAPALRDRLLRGRILPEFDNPVTRTLVRLYRPFVHFALARPALTLLTAVFAVASCLPIVTRLGGEFLPRVDEGDLLFMPTTLPGVTPGDAAVQLRKFDQTISKLPEVAGVFGKVGRADTATDPAPFSMVESTIRLRPQSTWPKLQRTRWYSGWAPAPLRWALGKIWPEETPEATAELVEKLDRATHLPGWTSAWTAPARARMDMMSTFGVRTPIGIRVVAGDPARLDVVGTAVEKWAATLPGTRSAVLESLGGEPWLTWQPDPAALALHEVDPALAQSTADLVITGGQVGELSWTNGGFHPRHTHKFVPFEHMHEHAPELPRGKQAYRFRVLPHMDMRGQDADQLRQITVRSKTGEPVPLGLLGRPRYVTAPAALRTENGELVAYVYVDLQPGTDVGSYVGTAERAVNEARASGALPLAAGERIEWTGQYQLLAAGQHRLHWIIPFVALSMLGLLYLQFRSLTEALIVLVSVPFALVGSFWTLFLLHYPLSAPVWVGLLSTVGLAMQTGVVMVVYIDDAFHRRVREGRIRNRDDIVEAHAEGTIQRLRPKLMTITTMAAGLLPLLWAQGAGAEIMKRVAAPMLGGLATSAFLTLEVLPVLYTVWRARQLRQADERRVSIAAIVGAAPAWARSGRNGAPEAASPAPAYGLAAGYGFGGVQAVSAISPSANPK
ncbi:MAG TPA: efflux RND transporter permease subunit [Polyangia bacterium]|nr:efflux RND transporter permease subunit [Polyangia bacterium]